MSALQRGGGPLCFTGGTQQPRASFPQSSGLLRATASGWKGRRGAVAERGARGKFSLRCKLRGTLKGGRGGKLWAGVPLWVRHSEGKRETPRISLASYQRPSALRICPGKENTVLRLRMTGGGQPVKLGAPQRRHSWGWQTPPNFLEQSLPVEGALFWRRVGAL